MSRLVPALALALAALPLLSACQEKKVDTSPVLVSVNGEPITEKAYEFFKARLRQPVHPDENKARELILDQMINQRLLVQYAKNKHIDEELDVYLALQRQRDALLIGAAQREILKEFPAPTEAEIKARYDKEVAATHKYAYKVSHIVVPTEEEAKAVIAELDKGVKFAELAKKRSKGPTAAKGGDLGWIQQGMVVPEFFQAVMKIKKGDYSKTPVKTEFGWHVIRVQDARKIKIPPLEKVKADVARLIQQERINQKIEELRKQAKIEKRTAGAG